METIHCSCPLRLEDKCGFFFFFGVERFLTTPIPGYKTDQTSPCLPAPRLTAHHPQPPSHDLLHKLSDLQKRESQLRNELDREFSLRNALGELDRDLPGELDSSISNHNAAHGEHEGNTAPGDDDGKLQLEQLNRDLLKENSELLQRMLELQVENATYRDKKELQDSAGDPHH